MTDEMINGDKPDAKMSWTDTAQAMAASSEDWSDWEAVAEDGLADVPWETGRSAGV